MIQRELFHPDLRQLDGMYLTLRSGWWNFFFPADQRINWYGDCIRPDGDKGNGMYCTAAQAAAWPEKVINKAVIGPS